MFAKKITLLRTVLAVASLFVAKVQSDGLHNHGREGRQQGRARGESSGGGFDFSNCEPQEDGMCCILKESTIKSLQKEPILKCTHKEFEKCHYTYVTAFHPSQEEVCEENFEKKCQITFKKQATKETVKKCYTPLIKVCGGAETRTQSKAEPLPSYEPPRLYGAESISGRSSSKSTVQSGSRAAAVSGASSGGGERQCQTYYESSCSTKYVEKQPGKFVGDTTCEKLPVELCGVGCAVEEGEEECHDKQVESLIDVPEEICDLNPQKTCRFVTKLAPQLKPSHECTIVPQEVCHLSFTTPKEVERPLMSRWCIDPNAQIVPGETYDESNAIGDVISPETATGSLGQPLPPPLAAPQPTRPPFQPPLPPSPRPTFSPSPVPPSYQPSLPPSPRPTPRPAPRPTPRPTPSPTPRPTFRPSIIPLPQPEESIPPPVSVPTLYGAPDKAFVPSNNFDQGLAPPIDVRNLTPIPQASSSIEYRLTPPDNHDGLANSGDIKTLLPAASIPGRTFVGMKGHSAPASSYDSSIRQQRTFRNPFITL